MKTSIKLAMTAIAAAGLNIQDSQADTATLNLSGDVPSFASIDVSTPTFALDLASDATDVPVCDVTEICNDNDGYTVQITSTSVSSGDGLNPSLTGSSHGETISYSMKYGGTTTTSTAGAFDVTDASAKTSATGSVKSFQLSYIIPPGIGADTYTDTLTFTIAAK